MGYWRIDKSRSRDWSIAYAETWKSCWKSGMLKSTHLAGLGVLLDGKKGVRNRALCKRRVLANCSSHKCHMMKRTWKALRIRKTRS